MNIDLLDSREQVLVETFTTTTEGAPGRGDFRKRIRYPAGSESGWLVIYEVAAKDDSHLHEVRTPVTLL